MKKILLASTILAGTAGFAAADNANFSFSGKAYTGLAFSMGWDEAAYDNGAGADLNDDGDSTDTGMTAFTPEVTAEFTVAMMTTTDGGLEAGASITVEGGGVSMEDDHTDGDFGEVMPAAGSVGDVTVYLSGEWGKFEAAYDGASAVDARFADVDFTYTNSFGDFDIELWYEYRFGTNNDDYGAEGTFNFADYAIWAGVEYQQAVADYELWFGASASMNGFSGKAEATYIAAATDWDFYAEVGYSMDAYSLGAFIEDDGTDDNWDYGVNASYDLGGGVSVDAAYIFDNDAMAGAGVGLAKVGVSMSF